MEERTTKTEGTSKTMDIPKKKKKKKHRQRMHRFVHRLNQYSSHRKGEQSLHHAAKIAQFDELQALNSIYPPVTILQKGHLTEEIKKCDFTVLEEDTNGEWPNFSHLSQNSFFPEVLEECATNELVRFFFTVTSALEIQTSAIFEVTFPPLYPFKHPYLLLHSSIVFPPSLIQTIQAEFERLCDNSNTVWLYDASICILDHLYSLQQQKNEEEIEDLSKVTLSEAFAANPLASGLDHTEPPTMESVRNILSFQAAVKARMRSKPHSEGEEDGGSLSPHGNFRNNFRCEEKEVDKPLSFMLTYNDVSEEQTPFFNDFLLDIVQAPLWQEAHSKKRSTSLSQTHSPYFPHLSSYYLEDSSKIEDLSTMDPRPPNASQEILPTEGNWISFVSPTIQELSSFYSLPSLTLSNTDEEVEEEEMAMAMTGTAFSGRYSHDFVELAAFPTFSKDLTLVTLVKHKVDMHEYIIKRYTLSLPFQYLFMEVMEEEKKKLKKRTSRGQEKKHKPILSSSLPKEFTVLRFNTSFFPSSPLHKASTQPQAIPSLPSRSSCTSECYAKYSKKRKELLRFVWNIITLLTQLHHTYIARYYQSWIEDMIPKNAALETKISISDALSSSTLPPAVSSSSFSSKYLCIQMEYCGGRSLEVEIKSHDYQADKTIAWTYFRQILEALVYIHRNYVYHRSLKSSNIFVESDAYGRTIKLSDFGIQHLLNYPLSELEALYIPPEKKISHLEKKKISFSSSSVYDDAKTDVYALGLLFFELWAFPFHDVDEKIKVLTALIQQHIFPEGFLQSVPKEVVTIIQRLLIEDVTQRPTALELLQNPLIPQIVDKDSLKLFLNRVQNPHSIESIKTMSLLFEKQLDDASVAAYFSNLRYGHWSHCVIRDAIISNFEDSFQRLGVLPIHPPIIHPHRSGGMESDEGKVSRGSLATRWRNRHTLIDKNNFVWDLSFLLIHAFAQTALTYLTEVETIKRYALLPIYTAPKDALGSGYGYPQERLSCMFDILLRLPIRSSFSKISSLSQMEFSTSHLREIHVLAVTEAELLTSILDLFEPFSLFLDEITIRWTHVKLLPLLLNSLFSLSVAKLDEMEKTLRQTQLSLSSVTKLVEAVDVSSETSNMKAEWLLALALYNGPFRGFLFLLHRHLLNFSLLSKNSLNTSSIERTMKEMKGTRFSSSLEYLDALSVMDKEGQFTSFFTILSHACIVNDLLEAVSCDSHFDFHLTVDYETSLFGDGLAFHIYPDHASLDCFGMGGRYDKQIRLPVHPEYLPFAVGVELNMEKLVDKIMSKFPLMRGLLASTEVPKGQKRHFSFYESYAPTVVITVQSSQSRVKAFSLANKLITKSIKCEFRVHPVVDTAKFQRLLKQFSSIKCHLQIQRSSSSATNLNASTYIVEPICSDEVQKRKFDNEISVVNYLQSVLGRKK